MRAPYQEHVNCQYGAPMGRRGNASEPDAPVKLRLRRVPLVDYAYDQGGAYWGQGDPLWCAWGDGAEEEQVIYLRAPGRSQARAAALLTFPRARFYR